MSLEISFSLSLTCKARFHNDIRPQKTSHFLSTGRAGFWHLVGFTKSFIHSVRLQREQYKYKLSPHLLWQRHNKKFGRSRGFFFLCVSLLLHCDPNHQLAFPSLSLESCRLLESTGNYFRPSQSGFTKLDATHASSALGFVPQGQLQTLCITLSLKCPFWEPHVRQTTIWHGSKPMNPTWGPDNRSEKENMLVSAVSFLLLCFGIFFFFHF